jgi:hypothetical protein
VPLLSVRVKIDVLSFEVEISPSTRQATVKAEAG